MTDVIEARERGRAAYARRAWIEAHDALALADAAARSRADDLERLATAAYMLGRDDAHAQAMERAHQRRLDEDDALRAARCAFWIGIHLLLRGEGGPAAGWFGRAGRLVERAGRDCVERRLPAHPARVRARGGRRPRRRRSPSRARRRRSASASATPTSSPSRATSRASS